MIKSTKRIAPALVLVVCTLLVTGCATHTQVVDTSTRSFKPISYSRNDTCETQQQVAEHNSVYDTLKTGKPVSYVAPCSQNKRVAKVAANGGASR